MYASAITAINTVLFYLIKCGGRSAANVRTGLTRACLSAGRMRHLDRTGPA